MLLRSFFFKERGEGESGVDFISTAKDFVVCLSLGELVIVALEPYPSSNAIFTNYRIDWFCLDIY